MNLELISLVSSSLHGLSRANPGIETALQI
jgi:hypothetical protein